MQTKNYLFVLFISSLFLITSCASKRGVEVELEKKDLHEVTTKLSNSARSVSQSLRELARIERATHPAARLPNPLNPMTIGMPQTVSIDWTGPIGPLVARIAKMSRYRLRVLGSPPAIPIIVSITAKAVLLVDVLRDANFQCGERANIALYPANKVIELRYAKK